MKSTEIQDQINEIETRIQQGATADEVDKMNGQLQELKAQLNTAKAEEDAQAERTQAQADAVNAIVLPLDFNELFENTAANDTIIEVVREFQAQAYAEHNAELAQVNAEWQTRLENATRQVLEKINERDDFSQRCKQAEMEKQDAEQKRDAAATQLDEANAEIARLNSHIDDLQQQLANAPAPKAAIEIGSSDRLNELAAKAKESNEAKMARALARWNTDRPDQAIDIPTLPQVAEEPAAGSTPQEIPTAAPDLVGDTDTAEVVGKAEETPVTREEHEALKARVTALESVSGRVAA